MSKADVSQLSSAPVWPTPSDTPGAALEAVSSYVSSLVVKAAPNDTTPADEYQDAAADHFGQLFEGAEWDAWFDKVVDNPNVSGVDMPTLLGSVAVSPTPQVPATLTPMAAMQASVRESLPEIMSMTPLLGASTGVPKHNTATGTDTAISGKLSEIGVLRSSPASVWPHSDQAIGCAACGPGGHLIVCVIPR